MVASNATTIADAAMPDIARKRSFREAKSGGEQGRGMGSEYEFLSKILC